MAKRKKGTGPKVQAYGRSYACPVKRAKTPKTLASCKRVAAKKKKKKSNGNGQ